MITRLFKIDKDNIDDCAISECAEIIRRGGLVAFPTETVYGLGADATSADGARLIYSAKGRPSDNPLIIHIASPEDAEKYACTSELYYKLAKAFMPGPLTVIMKKKDTIPMSVTGGLDTVAVRCPSHPIAHSLISASGVAVAAPSANTSGSPSPTHAEHVLHDLDGKVDAIIDGGICEIGLESTIVKIENENRLTLLRPGAVCADALLCVCENVDIASAVTEALRADERPLSPGMKYRHYAPSAPLVLLDGEAKEVLDFLKREQESKNCAILCYSEELSELGQLGTFDIGCRDDLHAQAHNLFSALRKADTSGAQIIYAHLPPMSGVGLALYNRLIRAAAHTVRKIAKKDIT